MTTDPALLAALEAWAIRQAPWFPQMATAFTAGWRARERHRDPIIYFTPQPKSGS